MDSASTSLRQYTPKHSGASFPYTSADLTPVESGGDESFYSTPRFVAHIDDNAIKTLRNYYEDVLPQRGRILDFCSSWISHYPDAVAAASKRGDLEIIGTGMNESELSRNPVLNTWTVQDLNRDPNYRLPAEREGLLDTSTCVVSIDYLTKPVEVLTSIRKVTSRRGKVHLIISNRCFPTKVVGRWLKIDEDERLNMVGDYLWWSGWREIEIVTLVEGTWIKDPLWVVRATNPEEIGPS